MRWYGFDSSIRQKWGVALQVLLRRVQKGGSKEYLAYKVAQELDIQERIPSQTIPPRPFPIDTPWTAANYTDYVNIQSLVSNVQLTFLGDDWTRCIPTVTNTNSEAKLSVHNDKDDDFLHLVLDYTTTMALSIKTVDVDAQNDWKCCFRNMSVNDKTWRSAKSVSNVTLYDTNVRMHTWHNCWKWQHLMLSLATESDFI